jgi:hypothetical protein
LEVVVDIEDLQVVAAITHTSAETLALKPGDGSEGDFEGRVLSTRNIAS